MSLGKIIAIIITIPTFIFIVIPMIMTFWTEGIVIESLLEAFGMHPFVIAIISVGSLIVFILILIKVAGSTFG